MSIETLFDHYMKNKPARTTSGEEIKKKIFSEVETECVAYRNLLAKKPEEDMMLSQLKELINNKMVVMIFPS